MPIGFAPVTAPSSGVLGFINPTPLVSISPATGITNTVAGASSAGVAGAVAAVALVDIALIAANVQAYGQLQAANRDLQRAKEIDLLSQQLVVAAGNKQLLKRAPYSGGGFNGVKYNVSIAVATFGDGSTQNGIQLPNGYRWFNVNGSIGGVSVKETEIPVYYQGNTYSTLSFSFVLSAGGATENIDFAYLSAGYSQSDRNKFKNTTVTLDIRRIDGQPDKDVTTDGGSVPSGYTGDSGLGNPDSVNKGKNNLKTPILTPNLSSGIGWGGNKKPVTDGVGGALGLGVPSAGKTPTQTPEKKLAPNANPVTAPPNSNPVKTPTPPQTTPPEPKKDDPKKVGFPITPNPLDAKTSLILGAIASATTTTTGLLNQINSQSVAANNKLDGITNQVTDANQQLNAKTGACNALNSPNCTKQMEDNIKNPLNQNIDTAKAALAYNQAGQDLAFAGLFQNFTKLFSFLDNQYVDRALGVVNAGLNLHNAFMLSNALGKTAAGIVDNVINLTPLKFFDSNGSQTTASRVFGQNIEAFFINAIGLESYTNLSDFLAVENRIMRSATNLLNRTESLFAKSAKVGQKLGADIGDLSNAMLVNGVISPSSYPKKAASKAANDALDSETAGDISSAVSGASSSLKNLKTITGEVLTVTRNAQRISTEFTKLTALFNADSKVRKDLRTQIATKAKKRSIYTIVDIKQIKINADKRPNSKPIK
jgi:hypothetical protein